MVPHSRTPNYIAQRKSLERGLIQQTRTVCKLDIAGGELEKTTSNQCNGDAVVMVCLHQRSKKTPRSNTQCRNNMSDEEKKAYIDADLYLMSLPSTMGFPGA